MILILSTPRDLDTQYVIDWLVKYEKDYFRLNDEDLINGNVEFFYNPKDEKKSYLKQSSKILYIENIKVVWFRKFGFLKTYEEDLGKRNDLVKYLYSELKVISNLLFKLLDNKTWLFKKKNMLTKLEILKLANDVGINIPETLITSRKSDLRSFFGINTSLISKSIGDGKHIEYDNFNYPFYTVKIDSLENIAEKFTTTLFQKYIHKEYELRIFYIDEKFYSMVIFSQNNEKTKIDFRNYDFTNPNRFEPYALPKKIEIQLNNLMKKIGLNTGSIDMIKGSDSKYYFLEVNPSGQFGMTSSPCNYPLHENVANFLIKNSL
ncbi:MAG: grasp-with-spasm system ATP-grasp peptide maturase [Flavobacterium sp.]